MNITKDGNYQLTPKNTRFSAGAVYMSGALGTASVVVNHLVDGTPEPLTSGTLAIDEQYEIKHGQMAELVAVVTGSNGSTDFDINYNGIQ